MIDLLTGPLPPVEQIEFGKLFAPTFITSEYRDGQWTELRVEPLRALELHPASIVFHYGQAIFEGLKAFAHPDGQVGLFRPELNARRFVASAERMLLPALDEQTFIRACEQAVKANLAYVPPRPGSLYLRPTLVGSEPCIGVRGSREALFFLLALPAGSYFRETRGGHKAVDVFVDESMARAARGGTGNVKAAANYAVTLQSISRAKQRGCAQVLYLDSLGRGQIEEMGGMNIFFLVGEKLVTPPLHETILSGVTRASIIEAAPALGVEVEERFITIEEVREAGRAGQLREAFACGTAATIVGINSFLFDDDERLTLPDPRPGRVTEQLLAHIQDIQFGAAPDPHGWIHLVESRERPALVTT